MTWSIARGYLKTPHNYQIKTPLGQMIGEKYSLIFTNCNRIIVNINFCTSTVILCICSTDCHISNRLRRLCAQPISFQLCYNQHVRYPVLCFLLTNQSAVFLGQNVATCCVCACCVWERVCTCIYIYQKVIKGHRVLCVCEMKEEIPVWKEGGLKEKLTV